MKNNLDELLPEEIANGDVAITSEVVPWHFPMMNDNVRNDAYENALKAALRSGGTVLDIGSGSGLLAMMAARHGATQITTCEVVSMVAEKAKIIIERNGFKEKIQISSQGIFLAASNPGSMDSLIQFSKANEIPIAFVCLGPILKDNFMKALNSNCEKLQKPRQVNDLIIFKFVKQ